MTKEIQENELRKTATSKKKRVINKHLQIHLIMNYLKGIGFKDQLDKIDFRCLVDSKLTFDENLEIILRVVDELKLKRKP